MSTKISAGLDDYVARLPLLFIPIDGKITNFLYTCLLILIIIGKLISATPNERMITSIIFIGATPINHIIKKVHMPVSITFEYTRPITHVLLHSIMDREQHEKYLFLPLYGRFTHDSVCLYD